MKALEADGFCIWPISLPPKVMPLVFFLRVIHMLTMQCMHIRHAILLLGMPLQLEIQSQAQCEDQL